MSPDSDAPGSSDKRALSRLEGTLIPLLPGLRPQAPLGWAWRYGLAAVAAAAGLGLRLALEAWVGRGLPTYITFYPAVMTVALLAGFGPGLLATALSGLATAYWILPPESIAIASPVDRLGLAIFAGMGLFMSSVAALYRRYRSKAAVYDSEVALRASREALFQQREWLRVTLTSIGDAVLAADTSGKVAFINPVASAITGWPESEALGRPAQEVFRTVNEGTREPGEDIFALVLREGRAVELANHTALIARDGREVPIEDSAAPIRDEAGNLNGAVLVFHDVTEKRRALEELRQSELRVRRKLESILSPEGDVGSLELSDIVDAGTLQALLDEFHKLVRVPMAIIDLQGRVLVGKGWQDICTQYHRVNPETCRNCIESDVALTNDVPEGEFRLYKCRNNMWDVSTPIMIGDRHVGNVFMGQFFFDDEKPDYELFRAQARRYGFDEAAYLAALDRVPRLSRDTVHTGMRFFLKLARMISQMSYGNLRLARLLAERKRQETELHKLNRALRAIGNSNQAMMRAESEAQYLREVCRIVNEDCGHAMVWIGYADDDEARNVRPVAWAGLEQGYVESLKLSWADTERGRGPTGTAIRTGRPAGCRNILTDPAFAPWREEAIRRGYASSIVLPLMDGARAFGAINIYAREPEAFSEEETQLLAELARDLAHGIATLRVREARARAEDALRIAHERLALAQQSAGAGSWEWDLATSRLEWSPELFRLLGLDPAGAKADFDTWRGVMHPEDRQAAEERVNAAIRDRTRLRNEYRVVLPSGEVRWINAVGETNYDENGRAVRMSGLCFDITERRRAEDTLASARAETELRAAENQTVLNAAPVAIWIAHDRQCLRITGNAYANRMIMRVPSGANISASALPGAAAVTYKVFRDGVELKPEELPVQLAAATGKAVADEELELRFSDGRATNILMSAVPLTDADGQVRGAVATGMDITERKLSEENRRLTAETLRILNGPGDMASQIGDLLRQIRRWGGFDAVGLRLRDGEDFPYFVQDGFSSEFVQAENLLCARNLDGAAVRDAAGAPVIECTCGLVLSGKTDPDKPFFTAGGSFWTNEASRLLELKPAEDPRTNPRNRCIAIGHESVALVPLKAGDEIVGLLQLNARRKGRFTAETIRFFEGLNYSISIALGRKRAEEALHQHREHLEDLVRERTAELKKSGDALDAERRRFQEVLDALPAYVILLTTDYRVSFANRFFEERFGKSGGKRCHEYLFHRTEPCGNCETFKALKTGAPHHWEWLGPDGRNYDIHDFPFTDADGSPLVLEMGIDITERKRAEAELKKATEQFSQAQKMEAVGRLAGGVAHDFNNLMTVVTGFGRRVLRDNGLAGAQRSAVEQMTKAGEQAVSLTRQLLAFSRKQVIDPVVLDLNEAVGGIRKMLSTVLGEDIIVTFDPETAPWPVLADPTQIGQVIMNLAVNARDAMPTGGNLTIRTANVQAPAEGGGVHEDLPPGRYALLAVADTGTGMSEETRRHIFEPFFTTKGQGEGTGLGLSSVYGIVQQSGGHIRVDTAPGRGTTFSLYFPAREAERAGEAAPRSPDGQEAPPPRGSETILLLEDEPAVCDLLATELQELGYRVLPCKTAGDAIREAEACEGPVDLLLSDVVLPGVSGPTLASMLKERGRVGRVLFMSGHAEKHIVQHGVLKEGVAFIGKPFTAEALARKVREVLDGQAPRRWQPPAPTAGPAANPG